MAGPLSVEPLRWLIGHAHAPMQVAVPAHLLNNEPVDTPELPIARPILTCADQARADGIPVLPVTREWHERLAETGAEVLLCACWPWRLPDSVLQAFPLGAFNLHPSLLPRYRGPAPLFWQLRAGERRTGITLHRLSGAFDSGEIVARSQCAIQDEDTEQSLAQRLGALSTTMLAPWLNGLGASLESIVQDERCSSYQPMPRDEDFTVPVQWTAQRAYRFMRGTAARGHPYRIDLGTHRIRAQTAVAYRAPCSMDQAEQRTARGVQVRFADGAVEVVLA